MGRPRRRARNDDSGAASASHGFPACRTSCGTNGSVSEANVGPSRSGVSYGTSGLALLRPALTTAPLSVWARSRSRWMAL